MLISQPAAGATDPAGKTSSMFAPSPEVDVNALIPGQTYSFQISIINPLDDPVQVNLSFVRFWDPARSPRSASSAHSDRDTTVQPFPEPRYMFASANDQKDVPNDHVRQAGDHRNPSFSDKTSAVARRPRLGWQVYPSATSVPLNAFNEVWELEESEDLYASSTETNSNRVTDSHSDVDSQRRYAVKTAIVRNRDGETPSDDSAWVILDEQSDENDDGYDDSDDTAEEISKEDVASSQDNQEQGGTNENSTDTRATQRLHPRMPRRQHRQPQISSSDTVQRKRFVQRGHTTTLHLDLAISAKDPPRPGPLELAMHVTYRYTAAASQEGDGGSASAGKDFSFWASIRLGTVAGAESQS